MKRRTPAICAEERCASPTIKRTKVQAQRKFAQGCNNYAYSSAKITSKPADACGFSSLQTSQTASVSENDDCELNNFSSLPTVDDFLTFLCFRETEVLPERLNYLNTPRYNGPPAKKKPAKSVVAEEPADKRNDDEFENTSCKSKSPLKKKKIPEYKLRSCNVKTKNIVGKPSRSLALKHNQRLRTKSVVKAKFSENKLQNHKDKNPSVKKSVPHSMKSTKLVNKNLRNRSSTTSVCDKEEFIKPDTTSVRFKRVTRRNSVLELKADISKNAVPYKKLVGSKSKCNTTKKVPVPVENTRCCMKKPSAKSLRVSLPKFKPDVTNAILNKTSSKRVTRSTRSSSVQKETPPAPNPSSRPSRRTKEAATLYMEMLGRDMLCPDERYEDDDSVSVDSFPELPNTEEHIRREKELKEIHQKNSAGKSLCRKSNITNTKSFAKSSEIKPPNKDVQKNSVQEKHLPTENTKDEELANANGRSTRSKHYTAVGNVLAACKDLSVKISRPRVRNDRGLKFGRRNSYTDIFDKSKRVNDIFSKEMNRVKVGKKLDVVDNKVNKSDNNVKKLFDEKLNERKSKKNSKFKSKFNSQVDKCKKKHTDLGLPLRRSSEPVAIEKLTRKIIADDMNKVKSSDSEIDDETEPLLKILQKIKDKKAQLRDTENSGSTFEGFDLDAHPTVEKVSRRKGVVPKPMKKVAITANDDKELPWTKKSIEPLVLGDVKEGVQVESVVEKKSDVSEEKEYLELPEVKSKELTSSDIKLDESKKSVEDQLESKSTEISQCSLEKYEDGTKTSESNLIKPIKAAKGNFKELKEQIDVKHDDTSITMGVKPKNRQKSVEVKSKELINTTKIESKELLSHVKVKCKENIKVAGVKSKEQPFACAKPAKLLSSVEDRSKEFPMNLEEANSKKTSKVAEVKFKQTNAVKVKCKEKIKGAEVKYKESSFAGNKSEELLPSAEDVPKEVTVIVGTNFKNLCKDAEVNSKQINLVNVKCKEKIKTAEVKSKESLPTDHKQEELLYSLADKSKKLTMIMETNSKETGKVSTNAVKVKCKEKIKAIQIKSREPQSISNKSEELLSSAENKSKELTVTAKTNYVETVKVTELKSKLTNSVKVKCKEMIKATGIKSKDLSFMGVKLEEQLSSVEDKSKELTMIVETNPKETGKVAEVKSKSYSKNVDLKTTNIANAVNVNINDMSKTVLEYTKVPMQALKVKSEGTEKFKELKEQANSVEVQFNELTKSIKDTSALPMNDIRMKSAGVEKSSEVKYKEPKLVEVKIEDHVNSDELEFNELTKSVLVNPPVTSKMKPNEEAKSVEEKLALSTQTIQVKSKDVTKCIDEKFKILPLVVGIESQETVRIVDTKLKEQTKTVEMKFGEPAQSVENKPKALMKIAEIELKEAAKIVEVISEKLPRPAELKITEPINSAGLDTKKRLNTVELKSNLPTRTMKAKSTDAARCVDQQSKELTNSLKENSEELTSFKEEKSKEPAKIENIKYKEVTKEDPMKSLILKSKEATSVVGEEVKESTHSVELKSTPIKTAMEMKAKEILKTTTKEFKSFPPMITVNSETPKILEAKSKESTKTIEKISEELMKMIDMKSKTMTETEEPKKLENTAQLKPNELSMTTKVKAKESEKSKELKSTKLVNIVEVKSKEFTDLKTDESIKLIDIKSNPTKSLGMKYNEPTNGVQVKSKESMKTVDINTEDLSKSLRLGSKKPTKVLLEKPQEHTNSLEINATESSETAALKSKELTTSEHPHPCGSSKISAVNAKQSPAKPATESTKLMKILDLELYKPSKSEEIQCNEIAKTKEHKYAVKPQEVTKRSSDTADVKFRVLATTERVHPQESSNMVATEVKTFATIRTAGFTKSMDLSDFEYSKHPKIAEMTSVKGADDKELAMAVVKSAEPTTKIADLTSVKSVLAIEPTTALNIHLSNAKEMASEAAKKPVSTIENPCKTTDVLSINDNEIPRSNATGRKICNKSSRSSEAEKTGIRLGVDSNATRVEMKPSKTGLPKNPRESAKFTLTSSQSTNNIFSSKHMDGFSNVASVRECKISKETAKESEGLTSVLSQNKVTSNEGNKKITNSCDTSLREDRQLVVTSSKNSNFKKPPQQRSFFSNLKTTKDDKTVIKTVVSSNSKAFNLESKKITFKKNTTSSPSTEAREKVNPRKSEAFSPDNENSVYAFEPDLPTTSTPFRRWKPVTPPKSIAVQVNLESDSQVESSSTNDAQVSSTTDCGDRVFYIPIQTSTTTSTLGVAVKLDTDGPNKKIIMSATLITNSPTTLTTSNPTTVTSKTTTVETNYVQMDNVKFSSNEHAPKKTASSLGTEEIAEKIDKHADMATIQVACSSTSSASSSSSPPKMQKKLNSQSVKIVKLNKNKHLKAKIESTRSKQRPTKNKNAKKPVEDSATTNSENIPSTATGEILEAPTFYPTAEEFNDPLEYIDTIRPVAEKYGLCRIVPPSNFRPECKVADEMRFTAYNQYVHKMLHRWGPNVKEMMAIKKFLTTQNITFTHPPWIGGMEVDLPRLYQIVQQCGGLKDVIEKERWQQVADIMKIPKLAQDRIAKLDDIYCKYLLPYDVLSHGEREKLFEDIEKEWKAHLEDPADDEIFDDIDECIVKGRTMPLSCFYRIARNTMMMCFGNLEGQEGPTTEKIEEEFWNHVSKRKSHICVHSGSIDSGTHGYGFSVAKNSTFRKNPWNLKVLTNNSASILRSLGPIMGVTVPTLHVGMLYSACCWYRDPHCLPWIEYLHTGANKIWYGIPDEHSEKLKEAMLLLVPRYCRDKKIWLPSDTVMIPPPLLTSQNISMSRVVQHPGQFIVVFPKSFTSSISTGYLVSESVYFAHAAWLDSAKQIFTDMQDSCEPSVFSLEQLLICVAEDARASLQILTKVLPLLVDLRDTEVALRNQLKELGLNDFEKLNINKKRKSKGAFNEEDIYECETCRTNLFVSLVISSHEQSNYCLRHAATRLYKKPTLGKYYKLMYVYTEEELETLIEKVKSRIEAKSCKKSHGK